MTIFLAVDENSDGVLDTAEAAAFVFELMRRSVQLSDFAKTDTVRHWPSACSPAAASRQIAANCKGGLGLFTGRQEHAGAMIHDLTTSLSLRWSACPPCCKRGTTDCKAPHAAAQHTALQRGMPLCVAPSVPRVGALRLRHAVLRRHPVSDAPSRRVRAHARRRPRSRTHAQPTALTDKPFFFAVLM
jgi:hypothetical protein